MSSLIGIVTGEEKELLGIKLSMLESAEQIPHNNSSLLGHLVGVWRVLRAGNAADHVANAGLIHSVYATQYFEFSLFTDRERCHLSDIFGHEAEALAWLFCRIDRKDLARKRPSHGFFEPIVVRDHKSSAPIGLSPEVANSLFALECANFIDQGYRNHTIGPYHAWAVRLSERGVRLSFKVPPPHQPSDEGAEEEAIRLYTAVTDCRRDLNALLRAATLDPLSAEPLLLLAAAAALEGRYDEGKLALIAAVERLPLFGASWDKRLAWPQWRAIADALELTIESQVRPDFHESALEPGALLKWSMAAA